MDKLKDIKPGDRVRVTFEGEFESQGDLSPRAYFKPDGQEGLMAVFELASISGPTFHIERLEKPLVVGDRVRTGSFREARVIAISSLGLPVIEFLNGDVTAYLGELGRIA